jgi:hypothetical protein
LYLDPSPFVPQTNFTIPAVGAISTYTKADVSSETKAAGLGLGLIIGIPVALHVLLIAATAICMLCPSLLGGQDTTVAMKESTEQIVMSDSPIPQPTHSTAILPPQSPHPVPPCRRLEQVLTKEVEKSHILEAEVVALRRLVTEAMPEGPEKKAARAALAQAESQVIVVGPPTAGGLAKYESDGNLAKYESDGNLEAEILPGLTTGVWEEMTANLFQRYDLDNSGTLNDNLELEQLTTNLTFQLQIKFPRIPVPQTTAPILALLAGIEPLTDENAWDNANFQAWFLENVVIRSDLPAKEIDGAGVQAV